MLDIYTNVTRMNEIVEEPLELDHGYSQRTTIVDETFCSSLGCNVYG